MRKSYRISLIVLISLFMLACATLMEGATKPDIESTNPPTIEEIPTIESLSTEEASPILGNVIFRSDFSADDDKLERYLDENGIAGVLDGVYSIQNFSDKWMWAQISVPATDSYIEIDAEQISGPTDDNTGYGVICRLSNDADGLDGYIFAVSGDGFVNISRIENNKFTDLAKWSSSSAVNQGDSNNHLRASCIGDQFTLEVNGDVVAEATDSTYTTGDSGVAAISFNETFRMMQIYFDNLVISEP